MDDTIEARIKYDGHIDFVVKNNSAEVKLFGDLFRMTQYYSDTDGVVYYGIELTEDQYKLLKRMSKGRIVWTAR